jgi:uncharacterized membrane protein YbaN (DUF454 family)
MDTESIKEIVMTNKRETKLDKFKRGFLITIGTLFLVIGAIGIIVPLLPTTPLLLLSAACYYKGSRKMHHWMLNNKWFGTYLKNYREGRGIPLRTKVFIIALLWITIIYSAFLVSILTVQIILFVIAVVVSAHIVTLPTLRNS